MNTAIVLAAGKGLRMNAGMNKQYMKLLDKPVLAHTLEVFQKSGYIDRIILVISQEDMETCDREILSRYDFGKIAKVVYGGSERQGSVYNALAGLEEDEQGIVLIHDGARPLLDEEIIVKCVEGAKECGAVTAGVRVKETIKVVDSEGFIIQTPDRAKVWITQTPQAFKLSIIKNAHLSALNAGFVGTDDAMLVERMGGRVKMIEGSYENIKLTTPEDMATAEAIIAKKHKFLYMLQDVDKEGK